MSLLEAALKKAQGSKTSTSASVEQRIERAGRTDITIPLALPSSQERSSRTVQISKQALRSQHVLPPLEMELRIARQYQQIKRPLVDQAFAKDNAVRYSNRHVIMLASALSGEGKTFTSINLALSMALERDIEVLLVDADVAKPHVSDLFDLRKERGLLDLLVDGNLHPDTVILQTNIPNLSILPAGKQSETATELLASARMEQVVKLLAASHERRIVLFDSPPLLLSTESRPLIACAGQIVLVVKADSTSPRIVQEAIDSIGEDKPISLILNQVTTKPSEGYYGYGSYGEASDA